MSNAIDRALAVPELLSLILDFLEEDSRSLLSVLRVNSFWNKNGISTLWRLPPSRALLHIPAERRQIYADHIQDLDMDAGDDCNAHPHYARLQFPQLRRISLDTYRPENDQPWIRQYLQPNLREFDFYGGDVHDDLRSLLSEHCPRLTRLLIDNIGTDVRGDDFVGFLAQFRMLNDMTLHFHESPGVRHIPSDLFCHLAGRTPLQSLVLRNRVDSVTIRRAAEAVEHPFRDLVKLEIITEAEILPTLVNMIRPVKELHLFLEWSTEHQVLPRLWPLQDLEVLNLQFRVVDGSVPEDFMSLKKFPKLRALYLPEDLELSELDHDSLCSIFKCMPELRTVQIYVDMTDSIDLLTAMGKNCHHLETCILGGDLDLERLEDFPSPLLPSLLSLQLDSVTDRVSQTDEQREGAPSRVAHLIRRHAPKLEEFDIDMELVDPEDEHFAIEMLEIWNELADAWEGDGNEDEG